MTLAEILRIVNPYITMLVVIFIGLIGYLVRRLNDDFKEHIGKIEKDIHEIQSQRMQFQKELYKEFVQKETFFMTVGEIKGTINQIFDQIKEQGKNVNQMIGELKAEREKTNG